MLTSHHKRFLSTHYSIRGRNSGFLLIEVLIAIVVFTGGILGLLALQTAMLKSSTDAELRNQASGLANELVTQMWIRNTSDPGEPGLSADIAQWQTKVADSELPNATGTVESINGVTTIIVQYRQQGKDAADGSSRYLTQLEIPTD